MAGDWMKIELELPDKPEVHAIAGMLNLDPDAVVGKLIRIWQWFDKHTTDGNAYGVTYSLPDRIASVIGFGEAMAFVGWLEQKDKHLVMPKFDRHTSASAKTRAQTAKRVAKHKQSANGLVTDEALVDALPREEKRRSKPIATLLMPEDGFLKFWAAYPKKKNRGHAEKVWAKIKPSEHLADQILQAVQRAKTSVEWLKDSGQFIPYPATWLNAKGWEDEPSPAVFNRPTALHSVGAI